ncbi:MAG TPA: hypothetical protein VFF01_04370, partial [Candidatus Deferrimicrobiaceae bacterium]|nr:hypothetical protein [Candidatus Deferrimicrobiaceae bacterium]
ETAEGLVRKVKPLWRVSELETAAYGFLKGIDYVTEECPMSLDATSLVYKEALSVIEEKMPGTRRNFYQGFLRQDRDVIGSLGTPSGVEDAVRGMENPDRESAHVAATFHDASPAGTCISCGAPTYTETCSYCRLKDRVTKPQGRS